MHQWAARGLDQVHDDRAIDTLINILSDRNDEVRESSSRSLVMCGNTRAIVPLQALDQGISFEVRERARFALKKIKCQVVFEHLRSPAVVSRNTRWCLLARDCRAAFSVTGMHVNKLAKTDGSEYSVGDLHTQEKK